MLNNQGLSLYVQKTLRDMPYEDKVKIYDANCAQCPFKRISRGTGSSKHHENEVYLNLEDCIESVSFLGGFVIRECAFDPDEILSLSEIVESTCTFWKTSPSEEGEFIEGDIDGVRRIAQALTDFRERLFNQVISRQEPST